ncbi:hypothetical protein K227x_62820 [Rubripirellula lacrimiformis]|uniref:Uncharacterized protein n=1 Tax=Rubripirellula lacrimiformis TaxID=1930273 RepID=A0A517NLB1_9BACT|nr:hypothetical protein [Rubripirellula lacrimiformis]QDT07853.1 hypothetical protein K227x_62820 [Rubripirellula lacrimiformis]
MNNAAPPKRRPPQISIGFMLLMTIVFAVMAAGLLYAARVPAIQNEFTRRSGGDVGRLPHIIFVMFTFTSPLLLAGTLSTCMAVKRWWTNR